MAQVPDNVKESLVVSMASTNGPWAEGRTLDDALAVYGPAVGRGPMTVSKETAIVLRDKYGMATREKGGELQVMISPGWLQRGGGDLVIFLSSLVIKQASNGDWELTNVGSWFRDKLGTLWQWGVRKVTGEQDQIRLDPREYENAPRDPRIPPPYNPPTYDTNCPDSCHYQDGALFMTVQRMLGTDVSKCVLVLGDRDEAAIAQLAAPFGGVNSPAYFAIVTLIVAMSDANAKLAVMASIDTAKRDLKRHLFEERAVRNTPRVRSQVDARPTLLLAPVKRRFSGDS